MEYPALRKYNITKTLILHRPGFIGVAIDAETSSAQNLTINDLKSSGFYIVGFHTFSYVEDVGAAGRILNANTDPDFFGRTDITTTVGYPLGDLTNYTLAAHDPSTLRLFVNRLYDFREYPIYVPGNNLVINNYVQPQQFVPVGALRWYLNTILVLGLFNPEDEYASIEIEDAT